MTDGSSDRLKKFFSKKKIKIKYLSFIQKQFKRKLSISIHKAYSRRIVKLIFDKTLSQYILNKSDSLCRSELSLLNKIQLFNKR